MKITTKGRNALTIMLTLADNYESDRFVSLKEIADKSQISLKYLEKIMIDLKKEDFVISLRGQEGGYKLAYKPSYYTLGKILNTVEKEMSPARCMKKDYTCPKKSKCNTFIIWEDLDKELNKYLNSKTLEDYIGGNK